MSGYLKTVCPFSRYLVHSTLKQVRTLYSPAYLGVTKFSETQEKFEQSFKFNNDRGILFYF